MQTDATRRQYDEVIAARYDLDPGKVLGASADRALRQLRRHLPPVGGPLRVLDLGLGTGVFLHRMRAALGRAILPFGLDISGRMIAVARGRLPDLVAEVDDAATLDVHFEDESFDVICTHFVTGFVPAHVLAPKIAERLAPGGVWSFVGGTLEGFPALRKKSEAKMLRWLFGGGAADVRGVACNPADRDDVVRTLGDNGLAVRAAETFRPDLHFRNLNDFLDFAYYGGWLTPFVERLGLHEARPVVRTVLDKFVFPLRDYHSIEIVLAEKPE
jgi:SAM-dependent methyltransferase